MSNNTESKNDIKFDLSKISLNFKRNAVVIICIIFIIAAFGFILINSFYNDNEVKAISTSPNDGQISKQSEEQQSQPLTPNIPKLVAPMPPPPQNKIENIPTIPIPTEQIKTPDTTTPTQKTNSEDKEKLLSRRKSAIMVISGETKNSDIENNQDIKKLEEINKDVDFKYKGNLELLLTRGKVINAVLENAVNTDFLGEIRAIITKDVFGQSGKTILIPKGSRVIGNFSLNESYSKIDINWTRIDLTNGYVLNFNNSPAIDSLGRHGIFGRLDPKIKEQLANVVLASSINILSAKGLDKIYRPVNESSSKSDSIIITSVLNFITNTTNNNSLNPNQKIQTICTTLPTLIKNNPGIIIQIEQACTQANSSVGDVNQRLNALIGTINSIISSMSQNLAKENESRTKKAIKDSYSQITDTLKKITNQNEFKPTVTLNQGQIIKIYVNKDFVFPKAIINKTNLLN